MPQLNEIKSAKQLGYQGYAKYIWVACIDCGKERWVHLSKGQPESPRCKSCVNKLRSYPTGATHQCWKGGRRRDNRGYIKIRIYSDDFFYPMVNSEGCVFEHRLVVAKALGRCLHPWEIVHHKEGFAKDDNRYPETLQLVSDDRHKQITILENQINQLKKRIILLEAKNIK